jgi:hypothetical protein
MDGKQRKSTFSMFEKLQNHLRNVTKFFEDMDSMSVVNHDDRFHKALPPLQKVLGDFMQFHEGDEFGPSGEEGDDLPPVASLNELMKGEGFVLEVHDDDGDGDSDSDDGDGKKEEDRGKSGGRHGTAKEVKTEGSWFDDDVETPTTESSHNALGGKMDEFDTFFSTPSSKVEPSHSHGSESWEPPSSVHVEGDDEHTKGKEKKSGTDVFHKGSQPEPRTDWSDFDRMIFGSSEAPPEATKTV